MPDIPWEILLAMIGVLVTAGAFLWEFLFVGRKRLGYRVQMDTTPTDVSSLHAGAWRRLEREDSTPLADPSFVLLRIENIGVTKIDETDYAVPAGDPVGIRVRFPGRKVSGIVPTELSDPNMAAFFDPNENATGFGMGQDEASPSVGVVKLPKVKLNRSAHYKVLVVLERADGNGAGSFADPEVHGTITGGVGDGRITRTEGRTGLPRWVTVLVGLLVFVALTEPFVLGLVDQDVPLDCAGGNLTLVGSTAFAPVLREAAAAYERTCPDAGFAFDFRGSFEGLRSLDEAASPDVLAFSDGAKGDGYPLLLPRPIAFPLFTMAVNPAAGVQDLSLEQIRQIYDGRITNWAAVNGNDLPVRLVGRPGDSGTRRTFENRVLGGRWEPARNSDDCESVGSGAPSGVIRCERPTTDDVLNAVAQTPGALGYGELEAASGHDGLLLLRIGGQEATLEAADHGAYPFWETEYAYTHGEPDAHSLAASFLRYLTNEVGRDIIRAHGQRPCVELENPVLCHPS
ncbi:PstS family phosphate ABC transporter substrate-binding protein [Pseudonocardia hierapolitana]|nr:substrate-binding domain-containing protein [Pseudonocardia hierapolitana]